MRFAVAGCYLLYALSAFGQSTSGTITGTISDPAGAVVPNAPVEVRNTQTSAVYTGASSATGNYTLAELPTGTYELSVTAPGFKKFIQQNILIPVSQTVRVDAILQVGQTSESVTVTAEAPILKTESGDLSHNVASSTMDDLPVLQIGGSATGLRNPYASLELIPGAYFSADSAIRVNGMPSNTESLRIEGQDATTGLWIAQSWTQPSVDSIQEVAIETSNYAAEFGQAGGGVFNTTMKSGTNQFHGSAYDYMVNEALNAAQPSQIGGNVRNRVRENDYGFTLGGPVIIPKVYNGRNKTFFFFSFEQFRNRPIISTTVDTVPTDAMRGGNFGGLPMFPSGAVNPLTGAPILANQIYDPTGGATNRSPFPGNQIPASMLDPLSLKIQSFIPHANVAGAALNNYQVPSYVNPKVSTIPSIKIDQSLSDKAKLAVYWSQTILNTPNADGLPQPITTAVATNSVANTTRVNYDQTITPTLLFHVGAGLLNLNYQQLAQPFNVNSGLATPGAPNGLTGTYDPNLFPGIGNTGSFFGGLGSPFAFGPVLGGYTHAQITNIKPTGNTSMTWVKGNHTYKFGGEFIADGYINRNQTYAAPWIDFSASETSSPGFAGLGFPSGAPGFAYASYMMGRVDSGYTAVPTDTRLGRHSLAFFAQDSWKVTRKITLDYGLRYDYQTYLTEQHGVQSDLSPSTPNPGAGNLPGGTIYGATCHCQFAKNYPFAFGPRLGLAYQFLPKFVLRAGFGVSYSQTAADNFQSYAVGSNTPYNAPSYGNPAYQLANGLPYVLQYPNYYAGQFPNGGIPANSLSFFDQNAGRPARTTQWSIGIQRELSGNMVVEATYVGNRGVWWQANTAVNDNAIQPGLLASQHNGLSATTLDAGGNPLMLDQLGSVLGTPLASQYNLSRPYGAFPLSETVAQSVRPYPEYTSILRLWNPDGDTWYNALQMKATKRFSHGFQFSSAFTWSKSETNGAVNDVSFFQAVPTAENDVFNRANNKYLSGYDQPYAFIFNGTYTTPKMTANKWISTAARDWQIGAVLMYQSGLPIMAPTAQTSLANTYFQSTFENPTGQPFYLHNPNCGCYNPNGAFLLNPAAWSTPGPGQFGTASAYYSNYRQQRVPTENMNIARNFRIRESYVLQVRAEFTNIFNRTEYASPASGNATAQQVAGMNGAGSGFGYVNSLTTLQPPRSGQLVVRFTF